MAYGLKYTLPFKIVNTGEDCHFDILENGYSGTVTTLKGAGRSPVLHSWEGASILDPVRGSKCVVNYVYERGLFIFSDLINFDTYTILFTGSAHAADEITIDVEIGTGSRQFIYSAPSAQTSQAFAQGVVDLINLDGLFYASVVNSGGMYGVAILAYGEPPIISGTASLVSFTSIPISDFLTTDETQFLGNLYKSNVLQFTGFMLIDDFTEPYLTPPIAPSLVFTDQLAILDNVTLADVGYDPRSGRKGVIEIISRILALTNLTLPIRCYYNLFPYNAGYYVDRDTDPSTTGIGLQSLNTNSFLIDDDAFNNCRLVLEKILKANDCVLMQQQGAWTLVRQPEYKRFNGLIPGGETLSAITGLTIEWTNAFLLFTLPGQAALQPKFVDGDILVITNASDARFNGAFTINQVTTGGGDLIISVDEIVIGVSTDETFTGDVATSLTTAIAPDLGQLAISGTGDLVPIDRNQTKQFVTPLKQVTNTFNYRIPQLLTNSNMTRLGPFIGDTIDGDNTLSDYQLKDWTDQESEGGFIRIVTNTLTSKEVDRYLVMPFVASDPTAPNPKAVISVQIEVNEKDKFDLQWRIRANVDSNDAAITYFSLRCVSLDGAHEAYLSFLNNPNPKTNKLYWNNVAHQTYFFATLPGITFYPDDDLATWATIDISSYDYNNLGIPAFPFDGILQLALFGFNNTNGNANVDCYLKDFQFDYKLFINDSIQIIGQENKANQPITAKSVQADEIFVDSSPKFNIAGGVFCYNGSRLVLADDFRKGSTDVTNYSHGEINAIDEILMTSNWRTIFEGDFHGLCNPVDSFSIEAIDGLFVPYKLTLDYRQNKCNATFFEVSRASDPDFDEVAYNFRYLYKVAQK